MKRVGVVDVGTNSVRLLVAEVDGRGLRDIDRDLTITRLGEGVDRDRMIAPEPLRRTVAAIAAAVERARIAGADPIRVIATSAVRDAANRVDFVDAVRNAAGLNADVLSGEAEALLGFRGATIAIEGPAPYLVCDIGGGSTELVRGTSVVERFVSLDVGSVRLTERHIRSDPPSPEELAAVAADADEQVAQGMRAVGREPVGTLVGLAGTITTVAAISLELEGYDRERIHHARLGRDDVRVIRERLAEMTAAQRRSLPAMPRGREDVIVAGVVILERVMDAFACASCLVSETDILDGTAIAIATSA